MALSKEFQEYHLTPNGWITGSFKGDIFGGNDEVPIPKNRVLTITCIEELTYAFAQPYYYDQVVWKSKNTQLIENLKSKWGKKPQWYGYEKMKE